MKRQIIQKLLLFYPAKWRKEYGGEFEDLLTTEPLRPAVILDVIVGALRQQVRMSNHPASTIHSLALMIGGLPAVFATGALLYGVRTIGYWVILQVGGVRQAEIGLVAAIMASHCHFTAEKSHALGILCCSHYGGDQTHRHHGQTGRDELWRRGGSGSVRGMGRIA